MSIDVFTDNKLRDKPPIYRLEAAFGGHRIAGGRDQSCSDAANVSDDPAGNTNTDAKKFSMAVLGFLIELFRAHRYLHARS